MPSRVRTILASLLHGTVVVVGAILLTLAVFLVLPFLESIGGVRDDDLLVRDADVAALPPPPPPPPPEEKEEEKPEDEPPPPPQLAEETPPLDLSQLELALNVGMGGAGLGGDFAVKLPVDTAASNADAASDALFSIADLDQRPRAIYQPGPNLPPKLRRKTPATVYVLFTVDPRGRVENPLVQSASDPDFEAPALAAVRQWKFEPGKRNGEAVRFRMRVPITFPKGS